MPFDEFEDFLHSAASSLVGVAFAVGVVIVTLRRGPNAGPIRVLDAIAVVAAVAIPIIMFNITGVAGGFQRAMFVISYLWYGAEAVRFATSVSSETGQTVRA